MTIKVSFMVIALSSEQAQVMDKAIQAGLVGDAEDAAEAGVRIVRLRLEAASRPQKTLSKEECSKAFHAWIDSHPKDTPLLSDEAISRESIYGDRGL
jgi:hypothetical protein